MSNVITLGPLTPVPRSSQKPTAQREDRRRQNVVPFRTRPLEPIGEPVTGRDAVLVWSIVWMFFSLWLVVPCLIWRWL